MSVFLLSSLVVVVADVWLGLVSSQSSEVRKSLSGSWSSQQIDVLSKRFDLSELIEGEALSSSLDDSGSGSLGELQGTDSEFGDSEHSLVVEDFSSNSEDLGSLLLGVGDLCESGQRNWVSGGSGLSQSLVESAVEFGVGSSGQELVELDQQLVVFVGGGWFSLLSEFNSLLFENFCHGFIKYFYFFIFTI